jgi:hypothetical protein
MRSFEISRGRPAVRLGIGAAVVAAVAGAHAQAPPTAPAPERTIANGVVAATRYSEVVEIPKATGPASRLEVQLGSLRADVHSSERTVPAGGFYVADLRSGDVITVIGGQETRRHTGDVWSVGAGESMTVRSVERSTQNALVRILMIRPAE